MNARENFWNVYCFATNQIRDETAKDNRQTAEWIYHDFNIFYHDVFFVAEKPSPKTPTCSVINFHNLQSLLGLLGSLVSEQMESSDWCWFVVKK